MQINKGSSLVAVVLMISLITACNQKSKTAEPDINTPRVPVLINDSFGQSVDKSPMDMSYFPEDYPKQKMITPNIASPAARVIYSRPQINSRVIFGDSTEKRNVIQRYGQPWRLGANEATEIEFFNPVSINGKKLAAGRYVMYCIPYPDKWKVIFNTALYSWGLHIDPRKDIAAVEVPLIQNDRHVEYFTIQLQKSTEGFSIVMSWGNMRVALPVALN